MSKHLTTGDILIKHKHVFIYYSFFMKKHYKDIQTRRMRYVYTQVAKPFYLEAQAASKIISKMYKSGYRPSKVDIDEFKDRFSDLKEMFNG